MGLVLSFHLYVASRDQATHVARLVQQVPLPTGLSHQPLDRSLASKIFSLNKTLPLTGA